MRQRRREKVLFRQHLLPIHETFWGINYATISVTDLGFDSSYAAKGVNYAGNSFMKSARGVSVTKHFYSSLTQNKLGCFPRQVFFRLVQYLHARPKIYPLSGVSKKVLR